MSFFTITIPVNKEFLLPKEEPKTVAKKDNASTLGREIISVSPPKTLSQKVLFYTIIHYKFMI